MLLFGLKNCGGWFKVCNFVSMVVSKGKQVFLLDYSNSHEVIMEAFGLGADVGDFSNFQKVEIVPVIAGKYTRNKFDWVLRVDGREADWWGFGYEDLAWEKWVEVVAERLVIGGEFKVVNKGFYLVSGSATVKASGSATVKASGSAKVVASGSAKVVALGSVIVEASGSAIVEARGSATVKASDLATVEARGSATVKASGSAKVVALGSVIVEASDLVIVEAWDSATVKASGSATVKASGSVKVNATMNAIVIFPNLKKIEVASGFKVVKRKGKNVRIIEKVLLEVGVNAETH